MANNMPKPKLKRDIETLFEISTFRYLDRVWKQFFNPDVANCAEHTFRVMWIALTLARYESNVNHEKIIKMAMIHDLPELRTGDVHYLSRQYTERKESEAMRDIFKDSVHEQEMNELFGEYEKRQSLESKIVKDADNLDIELELMEMKTKGYSLGSLWTTDRKKLIYPKLHTKSAKIFWDKIHLANPHDLHNKSPKNRFHAGDWKNK